MCRVKRWKGWLYDILLAVCILVFLGSGGTLAYKIMAQKKNDARLEELAGLLAQPGGAEDKAVGDQNSERGAGSAAAAPEAGGGTEEERVLDAEELRKQREARVKAYSRIREQNSDLAGWIRIEGTKIDYPVLQTPDNPNFYLNHNFDRKSSVYGAPYMAEECDLSRDCRNILIYGHHMKNGSMFAALDGYLDQTFYKEHPIVQFDTLTEYGDYQVMAVFTMNAADPENPIYNWIFCGNEEAFDNYVAYVKEQSVYDMGVEAQWGDHLISLITCEYTRKDGRLIVVAKKTEKEESGRE